MATWSLSAAAHEFLAGTLPQQRYARTSEDPGAWVPRTVAPPPLPAATATESPEDVTFRASVLGEAEVIEVSPTPGGDIRRVVARRRPAAVYGPIDRWLIVDRFGVEHVFEGPLSALRREFPDVTEGRRRCRARTPMGNTPKRIFRLEQ